MQLTDTQIDEFRTRGWTIAPDVFSSDEVAVLTDAALEVMDRPGPEVGREADGSPHVCWGMHLFDERLGTLVRHPALVEPSRTLLGNDVFVHQSRINMKQTNGSIVAWHQDFGTYHRVDGVPEPRGVMIAVFLDDVSNLNAPLLAVPTSHAEGLVSTAVVDPTVPDHEQVAKYRYDITPRNHGPTGGRLRPGGHHRNRGLGPLHGHDRGPRLVGQHQPTTTPAAVRECLPGRQSG